MGSRTVFLRRDSTKLQMLGCCAHLRQEPRKEEARAAFVRQQILLGLTAACTSHVVLLNSIPAGL